MNAKALSFWSLFVLMYAVMDWANPGWLLFQGFWLGWFFSCASLLAVAWRMQFNYRFHPWTWRVLIGSGAAVLSLAGFTSKGYEPAIPELIQYMVPQICFLFPVMILEGSILNGELNGNSATA